MTDANRTPESRIQRLEEMMVQLGTITQIRGQLSDEQERRLNQLEELTVTLGQNVQALNANTQALNEIASQHAERMAGIERTMARIEDTNASLNAAIERLDRLMDYVINRDRNQES